MLYLLQLLLYKESIKKLNNIDYKINEEEVCNLLPLMTRKHSEKLK